MEQFLIVVTYVNEHLMLKQVSLITIIAMVTKNLLIATSAANLLFYLANLKFTN